MCPWHLSTSLQMLNHSPVCSPLPTPHWVLQFPLTGWESLPIRLPRGHTPFLLLTGIRQWWAGPISLKELQPGKPLSVPLPLPLNWERRARAGEWPTESFFSLIIRLVSKAGQHLRLEKADMKQVAITNYTSPFSHDRGVGVKRGARQVLSI